MLYSSIMYFIYCNLGHAYIREREKHEPLGSEFCEEKQSDSFHLENCLGQLQE